MNKIKRIFTVLMASVILISFVSLPAEAAITPRSTLHIDVWGDAPSNRLSLKARISINDATNKVVGAQGVIDYMYGINVIDSSISWTTVSIASGGAYAYCAVSYRTTNGNTYTETIKFYPN